MANQNLPSQILKPDLVALATGQFVIPRAQLSYDRLSLFILPFGEDVTVTLKVAFPTVEGGPAILPLNLAIGAVAPAGRAFIFTTEDLYPGDLLIEIVAADPPPSRVELLVVLKR